MSIQALLASYGAPSGPAYKPHRYWKITCTAVQSGTLLLGQGPSGFSLAGGPLIPPSVVTASSAAFESAAGFFNVGQRWSTNFSGTEWVEADLGSPFAVGDLAMVGNASFPTRTMKNFKVEWSDDNSTWTQSAVFSGVDLTTNTTLHFTVGDPA